MHVRRNGRPAGLMNGVVAGALGTALALCAGSARGDLIDNLSDVVFEITATNAQGSATFQVTQDMGTFGADTFLWTSGGSIALIDPDTQNTIATLDSGLINYIGDPQMSWAFAVTAGLSDTTLSITSGLLGFGTTFGDPIGQVSAGLTLTDGNGNGASLTGPGGTLASFQYNGMAPGGATFFDLTGSLAAGPGGTDDANASTGGFIPIGAPASDMSMIFNLDLTAGDQVSGSGNYQVLIPAPAGLVLLAGLFMGRRRRRR